MTAAYAALGAAGVLALLVYAIARAHLQLVARHDSLQEFVAQLADDYAHLAPGEARRELQSLLETGLRTQRRQCVEATNMDRERIYVLEQHLGIAREGQEPTPEHVRRAIADHARRQAEGGAS